MATTTYREEIIKANSGEEYQVETRGHLQHMPATAQSVFAHFGQFERTGNGTLLYSASAEEEDIVSLNTMYLDDLAALKDGNFQIVDLVA